MIYINVDELLADAATTLREAYIAGHAARDAEVEELRATLAKVASAARGFAANGDFAAQVILAILDESPTEREGVS